MSLMLEVKDLFVKWIQVFVEDLDHVVNMEDNFGYSSRADANSD